MKRIPLIAGNWKMNTSQAEAAQLASEIAAGFGTRSDVDVAIFPPYCWLGLVKAQITGSSVQVGAQNCAEFDSGAFTGEVSASMIAENGNYVILGHSERRRLMGETSESVNRKIQVALEADLVPVVCVGEQLDVRQSGNALAYVSLQLQTSLAGLSSAALNRIVIAYEPVWAIGTGIAASSDDAQEMTAAIRSWLKAAEMGTVNQVRILYGGSVNSINAGSYLGQADVDGVLVGGASLTSGEFLAICDAAR